MALQFSVKLCRERAFGFCLLWKKAGKRTNCINSCSLAYLSHFLTMTSILSRETRKEEDADYVWGLHPPSWCLSGYRRSVPPATDLFSPRGRQRWTTPAGCQPELCCPAPAWGAMPRAALTSGFLGSSSPLCWGLWEMHHWRSLLPDPLPTLVLLLFCFPRTTWRNVCLSQLATHTHCGFCCRGLPSFAELLTMYFRPDLKTLTKQAKRKN